MQTESLMFLGDVASSLMLSLLLCIPIALLLLYLIDRNQTRHALRRNYPLLARFRYLFEHLGEFFRQYFFAMDREEMPFNRAERSWSLSGSKESRFDHSLWLHSRLTCSRHGSVCQLCFSKTQ